jgi:predicted ATPase
LHQLFTLSVEQGRREQVMAILAELLPGLVNVEILTEGDRPLLELVYRDRSVPAVLSGDGVQSLIRLSLELAARPQGVVLVEEPELHQHPGALRQSARAILAAVRRNVQVILTTHSLEFIDDLVSESTDEELNLLSLYSMQLEDGTLKLFRKAGPDVAFARTQIHDDLR